MLKKRRNRNIKTPKYFYVLILFLNLFLGVGYSILNSNLRLEGRVIATGNNWNIIFENITYNTDNFTQNKVVNITNGTSLNFSLNLINPGDKYEFTFDIKNKGTLDALIKSLNIDQLTEEQKVYLEYKVTYLDGSEIEVNDLLKKGESKKVKVTLRYKNLRATDLLPTEDVNLNLNIGINYYQPQEEKYNVTLIHNSETKNYTTKNISQELSLNDINIKENDKVIACNNGTVPTTDDNGLITIKHIKQDTICRIESSLKQGIENSDTTKNNLTLLNDEINIEPISIIVEENKNIAINLNGKTNKFNSNTDVSYIKNNGHLYIFDTTSIGKLQTDYRLITNNEKGILIIDGGNYIRSLESNNSKDGGVIASSGYTIVKNATIQTDNAYAVYSSGGIVQIDNCTINRTGTESNGVIVLYSNQSNINIYNSNITSVSSYPIKAYSQESSSIYICNSKIRANDSTDIQIENNKNSIFYSNNTIFSNGTNNPVAIGHPIRNEIACKE